MAEEVNVIINNLCTKFGTTIQNLVPEMARLNIAEGITTIIICVIVFICLYKPEDIPFDRLVQQG